MTTKKTATKKAVAGKPEVKSVAKKAPSKVTAKASAAVKPTARKTAAKSATAKKAPAKKAAGKAAKNENYTKPELREKIKKQVMDGDKGGRPGQWSARKAQMVAHEYVAEGGDYKHPRNEAQEHLKQWGDEKWHTADGKPAIRDDEKGETTQRYLPDEAWKELSPEEKKATDAKKVRGSHEGKQFVPNTDKAKKARKNAVKE